MKILYLAAIRLPTDRAHGLQIMKTCEAFVKEGVQIELVIPARANTLTEDPFTYYAVPSVFPLTVLRTPDLVRFGRIGFITSALIFSERVRWLGRFRSADIVYSREAFVLLQYIFLGRKLVFEAHANPSPLASFVARHAHRVVVISHALKTAYETAGVAPEKIIIAPDAVDARAFEVTSRKEDVRQRLGLSAVARIVMYVGHLYARKGADTLAAAAALMPEDQVVFVGGTKSDVARFRKQWENQKNIHLVGHVPPTQVPQYLRAADVLVLPNSARDTDAREFTSPMKLFEYMASGTPIVASNVPSIREILGEQEAQFVDPDNAVALAAGVATVCAHERESSARAGAARRKAEEYTWEKRARSISTAL